MRSKQWACPIILKQGETNKNSSSPTTKRPEKAVSSQCRFLCLCNLVPTIHSLSWGFFKPKDFLLWLPDLLRPLSLLHSPCCLCPIRIQVTNMEMAVSTYKLINLLTFLAEANWIRMIMNMNMIFTSNTYRLKLNFLLLYIYFSLHTATDCFDWGLFCT